jgi:phage major head subunit gpT-like protein
MAVNQGFVGYGKLLEPGLRKLVFETYKEKPEQYSQYCNVLTSKKAMETDLRMGGFSMFNTKGSLDSTEYEDPTQADFVQYKHTTFSKGFIVEKELYDDEMYNVINRMPKALARAARATIETQTANLLNNAFTTSPTNWKGEALVSATHARLDGGTTTNLIGALALSEANLETAMILAAQQVDERGLKIQMNPDVLIVPRALEYTAMKILKTDRALGNNNNDINPMKGQFKLVVLDYMTSSTNWFLVDSSMNPLNFFWREKPSFKNMDDFDTDASKYKMRFRFSYGWTDHRGILGSNA